MLYPDLDMACSHSGRWDDGKWVQGDGNPCGGPCGGSRSRRVGRESRGHSMLTTARLQLCYTHLDAHAVLCSHVSGKGVKPYQPCMLPVTLHGDHAIVDEALDYLAHRGRDKVRGAGRPSPGHLIPGCPQCRSGTVVFVIGPVTGLLFTLAATPVLPLGVSIRVAGVAVLVPAAVAVVPISISISISIPIPAVVMASDGWAPRATPAVSGRAGRCVAGAVTVAVMRLGAG